MRARAISRDNVMLGGRPGFTLLDMVVVMLTLGLIMLLGVATLLGAIRMERAATAAFNHQTLRNVLADEFRDDVAQAAEAPAGADKVTAGPTCLILRMADDRHVIYRWNDNQLERSELAGSGASRRRLPLGRDEVAVEFARTGADRRLLIMRLSKSLGPGNRKRQVEIAAALGGDLR